MNTPLVWLMHALPTLAKTVFSHVRVRLIPAVKPVRGALMLEVTPQ
jgi:hypothetical protein